MKDEKTEASGDRDGPIAEKSDTLAAEQDTAQAHHPEELVRSELEAVKKELAEKAGEADKYRDLYLRERAELENFKKRMQRERAEALKYENETLIRELLPTIDNLDRAVEHARGESAAQSLSAGVEMVLNALLATLQRFGVSEVLAKGEPFDPEKHDAIAYVETNEPGPPLVIEEHQKGYFYKDRLLRPALVTVTKPASTKDSQLVNGQDRDSVEKPQRDD
jgi:molecular chaperone GrpE